jgi:hypothetical protein
MDSFSVIDLYQQLAPAELFRLLQRQMGVIVHNGIYSARVVIWMMINQSTSDCMPGGRWPAAWSSWYKAGSIPC